jgi:hypothetical protein
LIIKRKVVKEVLATTFMMVYKYHCKHWMWCDRLTCCESTSKKSCCC